MAREHTVLVLGLSQLTTGAARQPKCCPGAYDLHDCMHPLTPTALGHREFYRRFAALSKVAGKKNPLRSLSTRFPFREIPRILYAEAQYQRALKNAHRDFRRR